MSIVRPGWEGHHEEATIFCDYTRWKTHFTQRRTCQNPALGRFLLLASVSCADDLLPSKLQLHQPLFLVVHTGDNFDAAVEQIELIRDQHPGGRIAIVADHYRLGELVSAFRAGVNGDFVDMTCDVFIKSMELVMMGETIFPPAFLSFVLDPEGAILARPRRATKTTRRCPSGPRTLSRRCFPRGRN